SAIPDVLSRQAPPRPVLDLADAARPARCRAIVLAGRAAGAAKDRRTSAGHVAPQYRRDDDHRRPRDPDRRVLGDTPVLEVRQDHHDLRVRGLRDAGLLAGAHAHDPVRGPARLAPDLGPPVADVGISLLLAAAVGLRGPLRRADPGRDLRPARRLLPLHPTVHARAR